MKIKAVCFFKQVHIYEKRSQNWVCFDMPKDKEDSKRKRKLCEAALKAFPAIAETAKEKDGKIFGKRIFDTINNTINVVLPPKVEGKFYTNRGWFCVKIYYSEFPDDTLTLFGEYIPCDWSVWIYQKKNEGFKTYFCAENFIRYFRKKVIQDYLEWLKEDAKKCGFDEELTEISLISAKELEHLRNRYYRGVRVRIIKMDDPDAPPVGTAGMVLTVNDMGSIIVDWNNGVTFPVIPGKDEVEIWYG